MDVQFKRILEGPWEIYKEGYATNVEAYDDLIFIQNNAYWYDVNGAYSPPGSLVQVYVSGQLPALGPSLGLSNF